MIREIAHAIPETDAGRDPAAGGFADSFVGASRASLGGEPAPPLIVVLGPTASGKSELAIYLAERLGGEIVSYDSVQVYRGLDIGSGKAPSEIRERIPHHLIDALDPWEPCTAGRFRQMALTALAGIRERGRLPILAGGTGLYLRALLEGLFEGPQRSVELRNRLWRIERQRGRPFLHRMLGRLDAEAAGRIHARDAQKVIRALEIRLLAGEPASRLYALERRGLGGYRIYKIGLKPPRRELVRRIDARVESMFKGGLMNETSAALAQLERHGGATPAATQLAPLLSIGYRQAIAALRGEIEVAAAAPLAQAATRQYAKRQMTWFRREPDVHWIEGFGDEAETMRGVKEFVTYSSRPENP